MCLLGQTELVLAWNRAYGPQPWIRHRATCTKKKNRTGILSTMKQKRVLICT